MPVCTGCGAAGDGLKKCSGCKEAVYCSATCQKKHWAEHKAACKRAQAAAAAAVTAATATVNSNTTGHDDAAPDFDSSFDSAVYQIGQGVVVVNLIEKSEYNGMRGKVTTSSTDAACRSDGRVGVALDLPSGAWKQLRVRVGNLTRPCNVDACANPAQFLCGRCALRTYCSPACCQEDWKAHRVYCEAPVAHAAPTKKQLLAWYLSEGKFTGKDGEESRLDGVPLPAFGAMWASFERDEGGAPVNTDNTDNFQDFVMR